MALVIEKESMELVIEKESMELVIEDENPSTLHPESTPSVGLKNPSALHPESTPSIGVKSHLTGMGGQLRVLFDNEEVRRWSIWWAMATCGINQVYNYMQTLWADIEPMGQWDNGWAELVNTVIGALVAFTDQYLHIDWTRYTSILLVSTSMLISILLLTVSQSKNLYMAYVLYVAVCSVYYLLITSARARIASHLHDSSSFGLVFGWNTLMALGLGTVMTMIVADSRGLALNIRTQFVVYGGYFAVISVLFLVAGLSTAILNGRKRREASIM